MKILKPKNKIEGCETLVSEVDKLDFGHCVIDDSGFVKLYNSITETMMWTFNIKRWSIKIW